MSAGRLVMVGVAAAAVIATACTPVVRRHGYVPETAALTDITPNADTKDSVLRKFGNPTTQGVFDQETWYYMTDVREQLGYLQPESSARAVYAVKFDESGVVSEVINYGLDDARDVNLVGRKTPTLGRELTILEQLLGNVGRLPGEQLGEENLPGGAGGPRRR